MKTTLKFSLDNATSNFRARRLARDAAEDAGVDIVAKPKINISNFQEIFCYHTWPDRWMQQTVTGTPAQIDAFETQLNTQLNHHFMMANGPLS